MKVRKATARHSTFRQGSISSAQPVGIMAIGNMSGRVNTSAQRMMPDVPHPRPYDEKHKNERQRKATHHRLGCSCREIGQGYGIADDPDNGANACRARTASPRASEISEYETSQVQKRS